jgi:hypothetical protein
MGCKAQRRVLVNAWAAGRTTARSLTGNHGRRRGKRVHNGMSETAAAPRRP